MYTFDIMFVGDRNFYSMDFDSLAEACDWASNAGYGDYKIYSGTHLLYEGFGDE